MSCAKDREAYPAAVWAKAPAQSARVLASRCAAAVMAAVWFIVSMKPKKTIMSLSMMNIDPLLAESGGLQQGHAAPASVFHDGCRIFFARPAMNLRFFSFDSAGSNLPEKNLDCNVRLWTND